MDYKDLIEISKKDFRNEAHSILNQYSYYTVDMYIPLEEDDTKFCINPKVEELAEELYNMDKFSFDKRYSYPVVAGKLLNQFDIEIVEDGVKILTDETDAIRVKKALIQLIYPSTGRSIETLREELKSV